MVAMNASVGMLNLLYKYKFCGLPKGVNMPPKFAAIFCIIKVNAIYCFLFVDESTKYPSGKKVSSAMSLASSIEPKNVTYTSASIQARVVLKILTIFVANT